MSQNESFDSAVLAIAYSGDNRNQTSISHDTFERCSKSIYNVPVVANYSREDDSIGGHDVEIVRKDGVPTLVNVTQPVGVVPESSQYWWEDVVEENGDVHEYFCTDVLLWKRQEAYAKIKKDGVTAQSMEIKVKASHMDNGILVIEDFEFLAFCLLGNCEPCFESAALTMFSNNTFTADFHSMLSEVPSVDLSKLEGVNKSLNEKLKLMEEYGLKIEDLDFELADTELDALPEKFAAVRINLGLEPVCEPADEQAESKALAEGADGVEEVPAEVPAEVSGEEGAGEVETFSLTANQIWCALGEAIGQVKVTKEWGECSRYWLFDYDLEKHEAYCEDAADNWKMVCLTFSFDGDAVVVDFDNVFYIKAVYLPMEVGQEASANDIVEAYAKLVVEHAESEYSAKIEDLNSQLIDLRAFKHEVLAKQRAAQEEALFSQFTDLVGNEAFEALRGNCSEMDLEAIEDKCFSIRGRMVAPKQTFSKKVPALPVGDDSVEVEPYGLLFAKYGNR